MRATRSHPSTGGECKETQPGSESLPRRTWSLPADLTGLAESERTGNPVKK